MFLSRCLESPTQHSPSCQQHGLALACISPRTGSQLKCVSLKLPPNRPGFRPRIFPFPLFTPKKRFEKLGGDGGWNSRNCGKELSLRNRRRGGNWTGSYLYPYSAGCQELWPLPVLCFPNVSFSLLIWIRAGAVPPPCRFQLPCHGQNSSPLGWLGWGLI